MSDDGAALSLPVDRFDQIFDVNLRGVYFAAREAAKRMIDSGAAQEGDIRIVNIASIAGLTHLPGLTDYCVFKPPLSWWLAVWRE